jgi:uncharacterized protein (DUF1697 family)
MARFVALLRGVSPMNASMPRLKRCFEAAGFTHVKTVLASGNVVFDTTLRSNAAIARRAEGAMHEHLDRSFVTIVRSVRELRGLLDADPFQAHDLPAGAKRVVTFLRRPGEKKLALPIEVHGARILAATDTEVLTAYVPSTKGAAFMVLIEKTFGTDLTTRTWDTVRKCAAA